jgi:hypothetical protein
MGHVTEDLPREDGRVSHGIYSDDVQSMSAAFECSGCLWAGEKPIDSLIS